MRWQFSLCLFILCLAFIQAKPTSDSYEDHRWEQYKTEFHKNYKTVAEETHRRRIFERNVQRIDQHDKRSYIKKIDHFTDMDDNEMPNSLYSPMNDEIDEPMYLELEKDFDWRQKDAVTEVKDQGDCENGDWAFTVTGALESKLFLKEKKKLIELSEQDLLDCTIPRGNLGCQSGDVKKALDYINENGISAEKSYPYKGAVNDKCHNNPREVAKGLNMKCDIISFDQESTMKQTLVVKGPLMAIVDGSLNSFLKYSKTDGVYQDEKCGKYGKHNVLIVGYGETEPEGKYWIVKNSWGKAWGDNGYMKIAREKGNTCGIASNVTYIEL
ncbi:procathepsin L-like [Planococcus citri]|uniref:procathepsin L-like n=1 Tax=Planococcus citri TaxID=170843 RepID=UPI0031F9B56A